MASSDTLREQVATDLAAIVSGEPDWGVPSETDEVWQLADAAIRVVLAAVAEQIEALPYWQPGICGQQVEAYRVDVLAVVARLGVVSDGE